MVILEVDDLVFRPWAFTVSHAWLLLRSYTYNSDAADSTFDVVFGNVQFMSLPSRLVGLRLYVDEAWDGADSGRQTNLARFVLECRNGVFEVIANRSLCRTAAHHGGPFETGPIWPFDRDFGEIAWE